MSKHESRAQEPEAQLLALFSRLMGAMWVCIGWYTGVGICFAYKNKTTTKLLFFVERKFYFRFLLILVQETRPGLPGNHSQRWHYVPTRSHKAHFRGPDGSTSSPVCNQGIDGAMPHVPFSCCHLLT